MPYVSELWLSILAERVGFEPTVGCPITSFQDWLLKPLGHLSMCSQLYHSKGKKSRVLQIKAFLCLTKCTGYARILWQSNIVSCIRSDTQEAEGAPLLRE